MLPIVVEPGKFKPLSGTKCYFIRDGIHRIAACEECEIQNIPALIISRSDKKLVRNFRRAREDELESILSELYLRYFRNRGIEG
jgi:hypothetical protein